MTGLFTVIVNSGGVAYLQAKVRGERSPFIHRKLYYRKRVLFKRAKLSRNVADGVRFRSIVWHG